MTMSGNDNMFQDVIKIKLFESVFKLLTQVKLLNYTNLVVMTYINIIKLSREIFPAIYMSFKITTK